MSWGKCSGRRLGSVGRWMFEFVAEQLLGDGRIAGDGVVGDAEDQCQVQRAGAGGGPRGGCDRDGSG